MIGHVRDLGFDRVDLDHRRSGAAGDRGQPGERVHHSGRADDKNEVGLTNRVLGRLPTRPRAEILRTTLLRA